MNLIGKKYLFFVISAILIIPGIVSLFLYGLNLSIEFTGGSRLTFAFSKNATNDQIIKIRNVFEESKIKVSTIEKSEKNVFVRTQPLDQKEDLQLQSKLKSEFSDFKQLEFETIGPTIGNEITLNAIKAIIIASFLIVLYITYSFRQVPKPASSIRFGIAAIIALIHDVLLLLGVFSIFGHFLGVEIDSLFVTAVLTVIGFSVHDTIVVFDRIRENLKRQGGEHFANTVNDSILQTLDRSVNTSLTVVLVLSSLLIFGGETIRWFVVALLIGIISGTYSSIFNAAPLLVVWQEIISKRRS
ncbi:MAG: protein-export membrane protein SecF [Candidatus Levybacteria bacterium RIFCSPLOWO2_01_FULL_36_13]|nr:MAG: protein-export membrane protein SecF [Candidatus Levybacteria bacterium RIFCSPHIGHO2_01_FULL_36_15b]OGH35848.1 MAG: protein-export membrane protein SecF [Candidatus Levybacteria bacterium RIFCSPLOWO2_01_FULL_36_13]